MDGDQEKDRIVVKSGLVALLPTFFSFKIVFLFSFLYGGRFSSLISITGYLAM